MVVHDQKLCRYPLVEKLRCGPAYAIYVLVYKILDVILFYLLYTINAQKSDQLKTLDLHGPRPET